MRIIRAEEVDISRIIECAREFTSIIPDCPLDGQHYVGCWRTFFRQGIGAIWLLEDEAGRVAGGIGGISHPDLLTGRKTAVELFWYVKAAHRKGTWPARLLKAFEQWARDDGCCECSMIHMECSMAERLKEFYERRGYRLFETMYRKKL